MGGTADGAKKALQTIRSKYGDDFYQRVGSIGGRAKNKKPKGFAAMSKERVSAAGKKGGATGKKRSESKLSPETLELIRLQRIHWEANQ